MAEVKSPFVRNLRVGSKGADVEAVKRALSRVGYFPWAKFDQIYNKKLAEGIHTFQAEHGIKPTQYNEETHNKLVVAPPQPPHEGEKAFDEYANELLWEKWHELHTPPMLEKARELLRFCRTFDGSYRYGGGHGVKLDDLSIHQGMDCSSSSCKALHAVGLFHELYATNSTGLESYGESDGGKYVTIHANSEHVWIEFSLPEGYFRFDTSPHGCGTRGPRVRTCTRFSSTFVSRHPAGM
jgi:hypothetical protein